MDFRHNAARRRRVMRDERPEVDQPVALEPVQPSFKRYQTATVLGAQPTLLAILPKTPWLIATWLLSTMAISLAFFCLPLNASSDGRWVAILSRAEWWSIEQPGSLGQMFLLNLSVINVIICYQIYHLRRHRCDDYHGAFQVWKWALVPLVIIALAGASVPAQIITSVLESSIPAESANVRIGLILGVVGVISVGLLARLYFEVRESRWATVFLVTTGIFLTAFLGLAWNDHAKLWQLPSVSAFRASCWWLMSVTMAHGLLLTYFGFVYNDVIGKLAVESSNENRNGSQQKAPVAVSTSNNALTRSSEDREDPRMEVARKSPSENEIDEESTDRSQSEAAAENSLRRKRRRAA